jgi:hypothetical protein
MKLFWTILVILYALSPIDLLPEGLVGVWGWLDDLIIIFVLWNFLRNGGNPMDMFRYGQQRNTGPDRQKATNNRNRSPHAEEPKDPYTILGISPQSSLDEIKAAYHQLAAKYHPDKVQHLGEEFSKIAEIRFKEIQNAYRQILEARQNKKDN